MGDNTEGTAHAPRTLEIHLWEDRWGNHHAKVLPGPNEYVEPFRFARVVSEPGEGENGDGKREPLSGSLWELAEALAGEGL